MDILLTPTSQLKELQSAFQEKYPHLKIEFFSITHEDHKPSSRENMLDNSLTLKEVSKLVDSRWVSLNGHSKVSSFEEHAQQALGIGVQVFRKQGHSWIQTTSTDDWTLAQQEQHAISYNKVEIRS